MFHIARCPLKFAQNLPLYTLPEIWNKQAKSFTDVNLSRFICFIRKPCEMSKYKMLGLPSYVSLNCNFMTYYINHLSFYSNLCTHLTYCSGPFLILLHRHYLFYLIELKDANCNMFLFWGFVITTTAAAGSHSHRAFHHNHHHQGQWEDSNYATLVLQFAHFCIN